LSGDVLALVLSAFQIAQLPQFARITFTVPVGEEQGGGTALGAAGKVEFAREDYVVASGGVSLRYQATEVQADRVEVDLETQHVVASGNVILDEGPRRLSGDRMEYDLESRLGTLYQAKGYVDPDLYFSGEEIRKTGEDTYEIIDGVMTSCDDPVPDWSFRLSRATVRVEGFARVYNTRMRAWRLPFFYTPFLMFPAKSDRASGFLLPNLGYSERQGYTLGEAYFQTLGPRADLTFYGDYYDGGTFRTEAFTGVGTELRYAPSEVTRGWFEGYWIDDPGLFDPVTGEVAIEPGDRWRIDWAHQSDDLAGMRLVVNHSDFSDFDFFRDFSRSFDDITVRQIQSTAFLSGNWGSHLLAVVLDSRDFFLSRGRNLEKRQLPEVVYQLNNRQLGRAPLYLSLLSSANYFQILPSDADTISYGRADLLPRLTVPVRTVPWLSLSAALAGRGTWWSDSVDPEDPTQLAGETLSRTLTSGSAQLVGPSLSKVFHQGVRSFAKFKHVIEPRFTYTYSSEFDDQQRVLSFDEVDSSPRASELSTVSLTNRLLAKPADETSMFGTAREIMSFTLQQQFSLRDDQPLQSFNHDDDDATLPITSQEGPITANFRFAPSFYSSLDVGATYTTVFSNLINANLSGRTRFGEWATVGLSWFKNFNPVDGETIGDQVRFGTTFNLLRNRVLFSSQVNYDLQASLLQQQSHVLQYVSQCWTLRLEGREFRLLSGPIDAQEISKDYDVRLALSLKNIGTFLDLNSSTRETGHTGFFY
jgi:lipopolysaccharide assembly outer membrane protein LptD (OstA)